MASHEQITLGLPCIRNEPGEVREFLPDFVAEMSAAGIEILLEWGYGSRMGYHWEDYVRVATRAHRVSREEAFAAPIVMMLRPSDDALSLLNAGSTFISMLHFPTHKQRARAFKERGVDAIALDLIVDGEGTRLVENMKAVAWNGLDTAFSVPERIRSMPYLSSEEPFRVTILGAGMVGKHAVEAATKLGSIERARKAPRDFAGVEVVTVGRNLSRNADYMRQRLSQTDILVDAARRSDPSVSIVPSTWLCYLPPTAVICDLAVDPFLPGDSPPVVPGIEGIPSGDLDRYVFGPTDPVWDDAGRPITADRRWVASCYSWPGLFPVESMKHYGFQIEPLLEQLARRGGSRFLRADGSRLERALYGASLEAWKSEI